MQDSDADITKLIERTEQDAESKPKQKGEQGSMKFDYAKLWVNQRDAFEDVQEAASDDQDSWRALLSTLKEEEAERKKNEVTGRGAKRKAAAKAVEQVSCLSSSAIPDQRGLQNKVLHDMLQSPTKRKPKKKSAKSTASNSEDLDYHSDGQHDNESGSDNSAATDDFDLSHGSKSKKSKHRQEGPQFSTNEMTWLPPMHTTATVASTREVLGVPSVLAGAGEPYTVAPIPVPPTKKKAKLKHDENSARAPKALPDRPRQGALSPIDNAAGADSLKRDYCILCGKFHPEGQCATVKDRDFLVQARKNLLGSQNPGDLVSRPLGSFTSQSN
jgi:hypothetical protein